MLNQRLRRLLNIRPTSDQRILLARVMHGINPCSAEWFVYYFHLFEAGIANAIPIFKCMKNIYI